LALAGLLGCSLPVRDQPGESLTAVREPLQESRKPWLEHACPDLCSI